MDQHDLPDPDSTESYKIAWICALEEEYFCAGRMLDEEFPGPETSEDDDNTYIYGRIAKHYVVIGCLPAGRYGTNSAARVARDMVRTFPHLRFALMVGIGGGAPTSQSDIRLGDVVVSQPKDGFGGVIQYDLGKTLQSGVFQRNNQLNAPPEKLLGVIPEIRRLYMDRKKPDRVAEHLRLLDDMEEYRKPAIDHLYASDYIHTNEDDCSQCLPQSLVERPARSSHRAISVHYGTIASGNSVVKDAKMRDSYANDPELKILCFEMEAAGLMNNIPCLVIRGICDYCDSHKNDAWHKYAALTAAAYARELLLVLRSQRVVNMPPWADRVKQELEQVNHSFADLKNDQRVLQTTIDTIDQKIDWGKLPIAQGAAFDSYMDQCEDECLPGTRIKLLSQIKKWASSKQEKPIFWLQGRAGTGKSTISRTIARYFQCHGSLGASFFFKRGNGDRGSAKRFFPTITRQLMQLVPQLLPAIQKALQDEPEIAGKSLKDQFDKLLFQPLQSLEEAGTPPIIIIVLDALDEGEPDEEMRRLLLLLPSLQDIRSVLLRVFLTSRPEWPILQTFSQITSQRYTDLILHEVPAPVIHNDVSLFLRYRLSAIQANRSLPKDWPGEMNFHTLVELSVPLFIFAATACRIFEDYRWDPDASLADILAHKNDGSEFDATYLPVLERFLRGQSQSKKKRLVEQFHETVGSIVILQSPLSIASLSKLLDLPERQISITLSSFHSVLNIPPDLSQPVQTFHQSFRDFLVDPDTREKTALGLDEKEMHYRLAKKCLIACQRLRKDICRLQKDGILRTEIDQNIIDKYLPADLRYSCRYWVHHTAKSVGYADSLPDIFSFLKTHFLHWMEAMSLLDLISEVVGAVRLLQSAITLKGNHIIQVGLSEFLEDAKRFALKNIHIADMAPLQIYCAGLIFAPKTAVIRQEFETELPSWISQLPQVDQQWSTEIQTLEGHTSPVHTVIFSPNGKLLASSSSDYTVRLWDPNLGTLQQILKGHTACVNAVDFSPNSQLIASSSNDSTIRLWDSNLGIPQQTLKGHTLRVTTAVFSPNGQLVASGSEDYTVRLWDLASGALQHELKGMDPVVFSPSGQLVTSASRDGIIRVWESISGTLHQKFEDSDASVDAVAFSPDGRLLASGSRDGIVRLWDLVSGTLQQKHEDVDRPAVAVAFSPNGRLLASSWVNNLVRLWDTSSGVVQRTCTLGKGNTEIHFTSDSSFLKIKDGFLEIENGRFTPSIPPSLRPKISLYKEWVEHRGERVLWLPADYRSGCFAVHDNTIALGHNSGVVSFLGFRV